MKNLHKKIREGRLLQGISQVQMAERLNISQNSYSKIENGVTEMTIERLEHIAAILGTTIADLLDLEVTHSKKDEMILMQAQRRNRQLKRILEVVYKHTLEFSSVLLENVYQSSLEVKHFKAKERDLSSEELKVLNEFIINLLPNYVKDYQLLSKKTTGFDYAEYMSILDSLLEAKADEIMRKTKRCKALVDLTNRKK